jgi:hypothetical protein
MKNRTTFMGFFVSNRNPSIVVTLVKEYSMHQESMWVGQIILRTRILKLFFL